jgi:hypothetical protein
MDNAQAPAPPARMSNAKPIALNLLFNVVLPIVAVNVLRSRGIALVPALALSAFFPALETGLTWLRARSLDAIGAVSLAFIALGIGASLLSGDVHFALAKESFFTAVFGAFALGSLLAPRPLLFYFSRSFVTGGDPARMREWNERWQFPRFRRVMRLMTAVWGVGFLIEALARVALVYAVPVSVAVVASPLLATAVYAILMIWTIRYGKAAEKRGAALRALEAAREGAAP